MKHPKQLPRGRIWSLNHDQEIALKQVWAIFLKTFGYDVGISLEEIEKGQILTSSITRTKSRASAISNNSTKKEAFTESSSNNSSSFEFLDSGTRIKKVFYSLETGGLDEDGFSDVFSFCDSGTYGVLKSYIPEELHRSLWASSRNEFVDNFFLNFLRFHKLDVQKTVGAIGTNLDWRINHAGVDDLLNKGDAHFYFDGQKPQLTQAFMSNEVFVRGRARNGNPIVTIRAKMHVRSNCPDKDYEKLMLLIAEWTRLRIAARRGVDQCQVLFDLTGFTLRNVDFRAVKFVIQLFQKWYPEYTERVYIHNAPKIFSVMWNIIYPWMQPYLRNKILFTSSFEELHRYIPARCIPKSLGGTANNVAAYIEPTPYNCHRKLPDDNFAELVKQRDDLTVKFIDATIRWIEAATPEDSKAHLRSKISIAKARAQNYALLDPYLRTRGVPDRNGEISKLLC